MSFTFNNLGLCSLSVLIVLVYNIQYAIGRSSGDDLTITFSQKLTLDKFREIVGPRLPHEYMKEDIYLIRWLRAQKFNIKRAEDMLMQNLKWRQEKSMDTILTENWADMETEYPYRIDAHDKQGQPVSTLNIGDWDLRNAYLAGKIPRLIRFLEKGIEAVSVKIRELEKAGKNVTRGILIVNLDHFSLPQHICPSCTGGLLQFLLSYETHYPGHVDKIILINVPPAFQFVLQLLRTTLAQETRDSMTVFNKNKQQWQQFLLEYIDKNQLTPEYGGTREL